MQIQFINRTRLLGKRHQAVFGPYKLAFVEITFAINQAGGAAGETYPNNGTPDGSGVLIPDSALAYVGMKRIQQIVQLHPGTYPESIGSTSFAVQAEWNADTQRLRMYRTSTFNAELTNGVNLANTRFRLLLIGV